MTFKDILMPDAELRYRVASIPQSEDDYRIVGSWNAQIIEDELKRHQATLLTTKRLLDFGCGSGRVLQFLRRASPDIELYGCDIDASAIEWCQQNLPYAQTFNNGAEPPLPYPDEHFDVVVALSVFSHLDAPQQTRWFSELGRILRFGGYLLISFSGPFVFDRFLNDYPPKNVAEYRTRGFTFVRNIRDGKLPEWYQTSLQTPDFIARSLPEGLRVAGYLEQGFSGWQDSMMIRRKGHKVAPAPVPGIFDQQLSVLSALQSDAGQQAIQSAMAAWWDAHSGTRNSDSDATRNPPS